MILTSVGMRCLDPVLTIACCLSREDLFIVPVSPQERKVALQRKYQLTSQAFSDHLALLKAYQLWERAADDPRKRQVLAPCLLLLPLVLLLNSLVEFSCWILLLNAQIFGFLGVPGQLFIGGSSGTGLPCALATGGRIANVGLRPLSRILRHPQRQHSLRLLAGRQRLQSSRIRGSELLNY